MIENVIISLYETFVGVYQIKNNPSTIKNNYVFTQRPATIECQGNYL
jgi:hypothetical protein